MLTELIDNSGLSRAQIAARFKVPAKKIADWESGRSAPDPIIVNFLKLIGNNEEPSGFRFIDLFAGIGGLRRGFEPIGGRCVFTAEWDEKCKETYRRNYPDNHELAGDIRPFAENPSEIPEHEVLLAGFPCQPFSIAGVSKKNALGRPHGFLCDTQGTLFFDTAQIIAHHKPAAFILENVKNLERHDKGRTFATIMHVLTNELGYHVQHRVISSQPWVPQKRERVFIVGFREPTSFNFADLKIPDAEKGPKLGSILEADVDPKYTLTPNLWKYLKEYKIKHSKAGNGFGFSLVGPDDVTRTLSARYYKDGSEILLAQKGTRPRRLTPRECARLMGFETKDQPFHICVSDMQAYKQFGNAVVVPVVRFLAEALRPHIERAVSASNSCPASLSGDKEVTRITRPDRLVAAGANG